MKKPLLLIMLVLVIGTAAAEWTDFAKQLADRQGTPQNAREEKPADLAELQELQNALLTGLADKPQLPSQPKVKQAVPSSDPIAQMLVQGLRDGTPAQQLLSSAAPQSLPPAAASQDVLSKALLGGLADAKIVLRDHAGNARQPVLQDVEDAATRRKAQLGKGKYHVTIDVSRGRKIRFRDLDVQGEVPVKFEEVSIVNAVNSVAIDLSGLNFSEAYYTAVAQLPELRKCKDWDYAAQVCRGSWVKLADLVPGQEYTVLLSAEDPGFGEFNSTFGNGDLTTTSETPQNASQLNFTPILPQTLLLGYGEFGASSTTVDGRALLVLNQTLTIGSASYEANAIVAPGDFLNFFTHQLVSLNRGKPHNLSVQFHSETAGTTTTMRRARAMMLGINNSDAVTNETGDSNQLLTPATTTHSIVNVSYAPPVAQTLLVLASAELVVGSTTESIRAFLRHNGTDRSAAELEGQDATDIFPFGSFIVHNAPAGVQQNFTLAANAETTANKNIRRARLTVIPLNGGAFINESAGISETTSAIPVNKTFLFFSPAVTDDYLILASADLNISVSGNTYAGAQVFLDNVLIGNMSKSAQDVTDDFPFIVAAVRNVAAGAHTLSMSFNRNGTTGQVAIRRARLSAIPIGEFAAQVSWEGKTANLTIIAGSQQLQNATVYSQGTNTNVGVFELSGNGTSFISATPTVIGTMGSGTFQDVQFNCSPSIGQGKGTYIAIYMVNSTQDVIGKNITVNCEVLNGVKVVPDFPTKTADINTNATYNITITNNQPFSATLNISLNNSNNALNVTINQTQITLASGQSGNITLRVTHNVTGFFNVSITVTDSGNASINDSALTTSQFALFFDNADTERLTPDSDNRAPWARGTATQVSGCYEGNNCWATNLTGNYRAEGPYVDVLTQVVGLNLSKYENVTLSFYHRYQFEDSSTAFDAGQVQVNAGDGWQKLIPNGDYPGTVFHTSRNSIGIDTAYVRHLNSWTLATFNLTSQSGNENVTVRFYFSTDGTVAAAGWFIDNITITGNFNPDLVLPQKRVQFEFHDVGNVSTHSELNVSLRLFITNNNTPPNAVWFSLNKGPNVTLNKTNTDWKMFRGNENHTGFVDSYPVKVNKTFWRIPAVGSFDDFASPAIVDDRLYIGSKTGQGWAHAFNATTGARFWDTWATNDCWDGAFLVTEERIHSGCRRPTFQNNVYALNKTTGAILWNATVVTNSDVRFSGSMARDSAGRVFVCSRQNVDVLFALNETNGQQLWNASLTADCTNSVAIARNGTGREVVYVAVNGATDTVVAYHSDDGTRAWAAFPNLTAVWDSSPVIIDDLLYVGSTTGIVRAINRTTGVQIWNFTVGQNLYGTFAAHDNQVFVHSGSQIYAFNLTQGSLVPATFNWNTTVGGGVDGYSSCGVAGGLVYCTSGSVPGSTSHFFYALNETTGEVVWQYDFDIVQNDFNTSFSSFVIVDGIAYIVADTGYLYAIGDEKHYGYKTVLNALPGLNTLTVYANNSDGTVTSASVTFRAGENVTLAKLDSPDPVNASTNLTYQLVVNNTGGVFAGNITLTDTYPAQTIFLDAQPAPLSGTNNTFIIGNLSAGQTFSVNITLLVLNVTNGTIINNTANISYRNASNVLVNATATQATTVLISQPAAAVNVSLINLSPFDGQIFLLNDTVNITVNATTKSGVIDFVRADITLPNGSVIQVQLFNSTRDIFNNTFNGSNLTLRGRYNITFFANDTQGTSNGSVTTFFVRRAQNVIDIMNPDSSYFVNFTIVFANSSGILNINITPNHTIRKIEIFNHSEVSPFSIIRLGSGINESTFPLAGNYSIDVAGFNFSLINVTRTAVSGDMLYKCDNFNRTVESCIDVCANDSVNIENASTDCPFQPAGLWTPFVNIMPGTNYTFLLRNATDPGFGEWNTSQRDDELSTTSTSPVIAVQLNFTPAAGQFLLLGYGELQGNSTVSDVRSRLQLNDTVNLGNMSWQPDTSRVSNPPGDYKPFFAHQLMNLSANAQNLSVQFFTKDAAVANATFIRRARAISMRVADGDAVTNSTGDEFLNPSPANTNVRILNLSYTPLVNQTFLVLASAELNPNSTTQSVRARLLHNGTEKGRTLVEGEATTDIELFATHLLVNATANVTQNFSIDALAETAVSKGVRRARITIVPLSDVFANASEGNASTTSSTPQNRTHLFFSLAEAQDVFLIASATLNISTATNGNFIGAHFFLDDVSVGNMTLGASDVTDDFSFVVVQQVNLSAGAHTARLTFSREAGSAGVVEIGNARITAIPLGQPDLQVNSTSIFFNVTNPRENENITINATVCNIGTRIAQNFNVTFVDGLNFAGVRFANFSGFTLTRGNCVTINATYISIIGNRTISVLVDPDNLIPETNETNNNATRTLDVQAYTFYFGNIRGNLTLADAAALNKFTWTHSDAGFIYFHDADSLFNFSALQALGRNTTNGTAVNDFGEANINLNMSRFNDSVQFIWATDNSTPRELRNFTIFSRFVLNVPVINSTNSSRFFTGILWDAADDTNGQYDITDKEDLVFVTNINLSQNGQFKNNIDYEARIPSLLRAYRSPNNLTAFQVELN